MRNPLRLFLFLFAFAFLFSCDPLNDLLGRIDWCELEGRQLSEQELSIVNFNQGDSTILKDDENNAVYLKCTLKEYKNVVSTSHDRECNNSTSTNSYYQLSANYKSNILNADGSPLELDLSIGTSPHFVEGNDPLPEADFRITYYTTKDKLWAYFAYSTTEGSDRIIKSPLQCPYKYGNSACTPGLFVSYVDDIAINNQNFKNVAILSADPDGWADNWGDLIEKIYYHKDYGIIRIEYRGAAYDFVEIFR